MLLTRTAMNRNVIYAGCYDTTAAGLLPAEVADRLALFGPNEITCERPPAWRMQLLAGFKNPFIVLLLALAPFFT